MSIGEFEFIGNLTRDIDVRYTGNGLAFAVFDLTLCNEWRDGSGPEPFVRIKTWGKTAENAGKYLGKGSLVYVQGRVVNTEYEKDGEKGYRMDFIADSVRDLSAKVRGSRQPEQQAGGDG
jgi:single-strand DNA-binding protein